MIDHKNKPKTLKQTLWQYAVGFASFTKANERLNNINLVLLFFMMILIVADLIGRSFFSKPLHGTLEITELVMVFLVFLSLGYTEIKGMNVRALTLILRLPERVQIFMDILAYVLGLVYFSIMAWGATLTAWDSWIVRQVSEGAEIPIYPVKFVIPVGSVLIAIVFLMGIFQKLRQIVSKNSS